MKKDPLSFASFESAASCSTLTFSSHTAFANHCHWFPGTRRLLLPNVLSGSITPYTRFLDLTGALGEETNGLCLQPIQNPFCVGMTLEKKFIYTGKKLIALEKNY